MVTAVRSKPGLLIWRICNETLPEVFTACVLSKYYLLIKHLTCATNSVTTVNRWRLISQSLLLHLRVQLKHTVCVQIHSQGQKKRDNYGAPHLKMDSSCHDDTWRLTRAGTSALTICFSCSCGEQRGRWQRGRWAERAPAGRRPAASCLPPRAWPASGPRPPAAPWPVWWSWSLRGGRGMHSRERASYLQAKHDETWMSVKVRALHLGHTQLRLQKKKQSEACNRSKVQRNDASVLQMPCSYKDGL